MIIGIDGSQPFNHGCTDYAIVESNDDGQTGVVIETQSCHSCWQVGHDSEHTFAEVGDRVTLRNLRPASDNWARSVTHEADFF
jgi:hypothetical protein